MCPTSKRWFNTSPYGSWGGGVNIISRSWSKLSCPILAEYQFRSGCGLMCFIPSSVIPEHCMTGWVTFLAVTSNCGASCCSFITQVVSSLIPYLHLVNTLVHKVMSHSNQFLDLSHSAHSRNEKSHNEIVGGVLAMALQNYIECSSFKELVSFMLAIW